jgi:hypothetical protein
MPLPSCQTTGRSSGSNKLAARAPLKLAIIVDRGGLPRFALEAIDALADCDQVDIFSCTNTRSRKRPVQHGAYYLLNLFTVRNSWTKELPVERLARRIGRRVDFPSGYDGAWQVLPDAIIQALNGYDVILKIGMGLMRVPSEQDLDVPILSFHHGDPDKYRGRPAGFWEIWNREPVMGQILQAIGNRLDAGQVAAFAETKVFPWSYRATLKESYRHSPLIINEGIRNALARTYLAKPCQGRNYRLPSNIQVFRFVARMSLCFLQRLLYGALFEKRWKVSVTPLSDDKVQPLLEGSCVPPASHWRTLEASRPYSFYADPFYSRDPPGLLVEALRATTGRGEIVLLQGDRRRQISSSTRHLSYPATLDVDGRQLIVPEMAAWSSPRIFELGEDGMKEVASLKVEGNPRIIDPTFLLRDGRIFMFGSDRAIGSNVLCLWSAAGLDDRFTLHPRSPIRISPIGSRMAGGLIETGGRLIRLGQDFRSGYGDGILAFEIEALSESDYRERPIGSLRFTDRRGPHTLNLGEGEIVFDWYVDRFSLLAGFRRIVGRRQD